MGRGLPLADGSQSWNPHLGGGRGERLCCACCARVPVPEVKIENGALPVAVKQSSAQLVVVPVTACTVGLEYLVGRGRSRLPSGPLSHAVCHCRLTCGEQITENHTAAFQSVLAGFLQETEGRSPCPDKPRCLFDYHAFALQGWALYGGGCYCDVGLCCLWGWGVLGVVGVVWVWCFVCFGGGGGWWGSFVLGVLVWWCGFGGVGCGLGCWGGCWGGGLWWVVVGGGGGGGGVGVCFVWGGGGGLRDMSPMFSSLCNLILRTPVRGLSFLRMS